MRSLGKWRKWLVALAAILLGTIFYHFTFGYHGITGTVVDADTGQPIEGAVAVCVWVRPGGLIEVTHSIDTVAEAVSSSKGRLRIGGTWSTGVDAPELTIYKRGYVAWNNHELFPAPGLDQDQLKGLSAGAEIARLVEAMRRKDFKWDSGFVVKMEKWKDEYSFDDHEAFVSNHEAGGRFYKALMEWKKAESIHRERRDGGDLGNKASSK